MKGILFVLVTGEGKGGIIGGIGEGEGCVEGRTWGKGTMQGDHEGFTRVIFIPFQTTPVVRGSNPTVSRQIGL